VLAGDFLFAQSSWYLANLDNLTVVKLLSQVIMDLAEGEIQQSLSSFDTEMSIETYLEKSHRYSQRSTRGSLPQNVSLWSPLGSGFPDCGRYFGLY
jgi:all-trans-nonaprenyl-diphosphate synthase